MALISIAIIVVVPAFVVGTCELARRLVVRSCKLAAPRVYGFTSLGGPTRGWAKLAAILVGPVTAYVVTAAFALVLALGRGVPSGDSHYVVTGVLPGFDAAGKLAVDDHILAVDDVALVPGVGGDLTERVNKRGGAPIKLTVRGGDGVRDVRIQPIKSAMGSGPASSWRLGVTVAQEREMVTDVGLAVPAALAYPLQSLRWLARELKETLVGNGEQDPGGPIRIVREMQVRSEGWPFLRLAMLAASVTMILVLGFDALRVLLLAIAAVRRRAARRASTLGVSRR